MRAIVFHEHGGPEALVAADLPEPVAGPGQATVRVHACALNRLDLWVRAGMPGLRAVQPQLHASAGPAQPVQAAV